MTWAAARQGLIRSCARMPEAGTSSPDPPRAGTTIIMTVESAALRGNAHGDPTLRRLPVWLPPSYLRDPARRYPVIYWLAGYASTGEMQFSGSPWAPGLGERLERLVAERRMGEAIV